MPCNLVVAPLLLVLISIISCRAPTETRVVTVNEANLEPELALNEFKQESKGTPLLLNLADASCRDQTTARQLVNEALESVSFGYAETQTEFFTTTTRVIDSRTFEREVNSKSNQVYSRVSKKQTLYICSETAATNSLEEMALRISRHVMDAAYFYKRLLRTQAESKWPELPALGLGLLPRYQKDTKRVETLIRRDGGQNRIATRLLSTETDNAFYSPFADDTLSESIHAISFIPQSVEARDAGLFDGRPLADFPVVTHHEYGHHVFQFHFGNSQVMSRSGYLDYWQQFPFMHRVHHHNALETMAEADPVRRQNWENYQKSSSFILSAFNEGFADLFAYYSLAEQPGLFDFSCFSQTREILSPVMFGNIPKRLDEELWNRIFKTDLNLLSEIEDRAKKSPLEQCSTPSFLDNHIVGAIIAHNMNKVFDVAVAEFNSQVRLSIKGQLLLEWVDELRRSDEILEIGKKETLSRVFNIGLATAAKKLTGRSRAAFCETAQAQLPALWQRWQLKPSEDSFGIVDSCI